MSSGLLVAFAISLLLGWPVLWMLRRRGILDVPGPRSSHSVPTPRGGGIAVVCGLVGAGVVNPELDTVTRVALLVATLTFAAIGFADDWRPIRPVYRFVGQGVAAAFALPWLLDGLHGARIWQVLFALGTWVWLIAFVNAYNFMDGINGISATQAAIAGVAWYLIGSGQGVDGVAAAGLILAGAALGFLPFNFPRAVMFLGDVGSYALGAWSATVLIIGLRADLPILAMFAPLALYLADTAVTLVRRALQHEPLHEAHRMHTYQRMTAAGCSQAQTTTFAGAVSLACSLVGIAAIDRSWPVQAVAVAAVLTLLVLYLIAPDVIQRRTADN